MCCERNTQFDQLLNQFYSGIFTYRYCTPHIYSICTNTAQALELCTVDVDEVWGSTSRKWTHLNRISAYSIRRKLRRYFANNLARYLQFLHFTYGLGLPPFNSQWQFHKLLGRVRIWRHRLERYGFIWDAGGVAILTLSVCRIYLGRTVNIIFNLNVNRQRVLAELLDFGSGVSGSNSYIFAMLRLAVVKDMNYKHLMMTIKFRRVVPVIQTEHIWNQYKQP